MTGLIEMIKYKQQSVNNKNISNSNNEQSTKSNNNQSNGFRGGNVSEQLYDLKDVVNTIK